jgi:hypothetical protein
MDSVWRKSAHLWCLGAERLIAKIATNKREVPHFPLSSLMGGVRHKIFKLQLQSPQRYPNADVILAAVERDDGVEAALEAACYFLDSAVEYLVRKRGAAYMLDQFGFSTRLSDALCNEMRRAPWYKI